MVVGAAGAPDTGTPHQGLHLIEETARHADFLREAIYGTVGE